MDAEERGRFLEQPPEGGPDIDKAHEVIIASSTLPGRTFWGGVLRPVSMLNLTTDCTAC